MTERYPLSLNAVNVVCFKIDWDESALKVLLIKRNITPQKNKWSLPGGFVNVDETLEDAALRKFVEETGIAPSYLSQVRTYSDSKRDIRDVGKYKVRVVTTSFIGVYTFDKDPVLTEESSDYEWFKIPRKYIQRSIPALAFDHEQILTDASNRLRRNLEFSGLATRFLPDYFTLGQIQDVYETIWEVELDPANFRDKLTNVDGWIREVKNPPEDLKVRRGKPPTWYKEYDVPQFERMISNPDGAVIREKESEYQKNLDNLTSEIPIIDLEISEDI